jgi:hypothetical protein
MVRSLLVVLVSLFAASAAPGAPPRQTLPLLEWDTLMHTVYDPRRPIDWPADVEALDGTRVRMEGYLMPRYHAQDPGDLFLVGINPTNLFCGPTDMTLIVEMYLPDFRPSDFPRQPVEVWGTFHLSRKVSNYRPIYILDANGWRELKRWEQDFPGATAGDEDEEESLDDMPR